MAQKVDIPKPLSSGSLEFPDAPQPEPSDGPPAAPEGYGDTPTDVAPPPPEGYGDTPASTTKTPPPGILDRAKTAASNLKASTGKIWDYVNTPLAKGTENENQKLQQARDYSRSGPSQADMDSPIWSDIKKGAAGAYADTVDTLRGFTSPLGVATIAAGPLSESAGAVGKAAGALGKMAGVGFGAQGAKEAYQGAKSAEEGGFTPENTKQLLSGTGQAILGGTAMAHNTPLGKASAGEGLKTLATSEESSVGRGPRVPSPKGVVGNDYVPPVKGAKPTAKGATGEALATEAPAHEQAVTTQHALVAEKQKAFDKAKADMDAYKASVVAGQPVPEKVLATFDKAQKELTEQQGHLDLAEQHAANINAGQASAPNEATPQGVVTGPAQFAPENLPGQTEAAGAEPPTPKGFGDVVPERETVLGSAQFAPENLPAQPSPETPSRPAGERHGSVGLGTMRPGPKEPTSLGTARVQEPEVSAKDITAKTADQLRHEATQAQYKQAEEAPKPKDLTPNSKEAAAADNDFMAKARQELGAEATSSNLLKRAQEMKNEANGKNADGSEKAAEPYTGEERRETPRSKPISATELESAIKQRKSVKTPFDETEGGMATIERDVNMPKPPGQSEESNSPTNQKEFEGKVSKARAMKEHAAKQAETAPTTIAEGADSYNKENGRPPVKHEKVQQSERAREIADEYDKLQHNPNDPAVKRSYDFLKNDIDKQWDYATQKMGIKFEPWTKEGQPYANSKEMMADAKDNKHVYFFQGGEMPGDHPLSVMDPDTGLSYNDKLRAIHDLYGHASNANEFGPNGEERAWNEHRQMFSPEAVPALTTETRGQNSWFNAGSHLRDAEGNVIQKGQPGYKAPNERPYAENKAGILPEWTHSPEAQAAKVTAEAAKVEPTETKVTGDNHAENIAKLTNEGGGATYNPTKGDMGGADAYAVPMHPELSRTVEGSKVTPEQAQKFMDDPKVKAAMEADPTLSVGTWANEGKVYFDLSSTIPDKAEAMALGEKNNQKAITYLKTREDVPLGGEGTGTPLEEKKVTPEDIQTVHKLVKDLSDQQLIKSGGEYDVDHKDYDFSKRDDRRLRTDRERYTRDVTSSIPEDMVQKLIKAEQAYNDADSFEFSDADRNGDSRAERAKAIWDKAHEPGFGQDVAGKLAAKGAAPEATAETAKMSNEELLKHGFTQEDIDAGLNLPKVGGGGAGKNVTGIPDEMSRLLTPEERAGISKSQKGANSAVDKLMKLPDVQEFVDIALKGEGGRKWYQRGTQAFDALKEALPEYFKEEGDRDKFLNMLAAGSPQQSVKMNLQEALHVWSKYVDEGRPEGKALEKMLNKEFTLSGAKTPNAIQALSGEDMWPDISKNRAFKAPSFGYNLRGWLNHVTNDGWMALFGGMTAGELSNPSSYHPLSVATRAAAEALGWEPAEAQAAIWAFTKALTEHGEKDPEMIKQYSEDFADLIGHDPDIQAQLKELGINQETLNEHLAKVEPKPEISGRTTPTTENSVARLSKRIKGAEREIPRPKDQGNLNFKEAEEFNPEKFGNEEEPKPEEHPEVKEPVEFKKKRK